MNSSDSFYASDEKKLHKKIKDYERSERQKRRDEMALDIYRLTQRKMSRQKIVDRYGITVPTYKKLLQEGEAEYTKRKRK